MLCGAGNHKKKGKEGIPPPQATSPPISSAQFNVLIKQDRQATRLTHVAGLSRNRLQQASDTECQGTRVLPALTVLCH